MTETSTDIKRRLRRAKVAERDMGKFLIEHDGPDPKLRPGGGIVSSSGRVGHITALRFDVLSFTYAGESKQVRLPAMLLKWWTLLTDVSKEQGKEPLLRWVPSNELPSGRRVAVPPMHIITEARHEELLRFEREARAPAGSVGYSKEVQLGNRRAKRNLR